MEYEGKESVRGFFFFFLLSEVRNPRKIGQSCCFTDTTVDLKGCEDPVISIVIPTVRTENFVADFLNLKLEFPTFLAPLEGSMCMNV